MSKILVTYFSASGKTAKAAQNIANNIGADVFAIKPEQVYTPTDLDWTDNQSRSTLEMKEKSSRPEIRDNNYDISKYDVILIGFPVWWYTVPRIINTFIESKNFSGKTLISFCTSGGSDISDCERDLRNAYPDYKWKKGKRLIGNESKIFIENWIG